MAILLFTRITNLAQFQAPEVGEAAREAVLTKHAELLRAVLAQHGATAIVTRADGLAATFNNARSLECALAIQQQLTAATWPTDIVAPEVCVALHTAEGDPIEAEQRARYLAEAGWGGQILVTPRALSSAPLPADAAIQDLGTHQFRDLIHPQKIYRLAHRRLPAREHPPLQSLSAHPHNLPCQSTSLIGRATEMATIGQHLHAPGCRRLTLVGHGGAGKTRLALQAAALHIAEHPDGVYYVPLAPLSSGQRILSTTADAIGSTFYGSESPQEQLHNYLREKQLLLVMDSFEHLLEHTHLLDALLDACPGVQMLVTSRTRPPDGPHTCVLTVWGMRYPPEGEPLDDNAANYDAIRLFIYNARRTNPDFEGTADDLGCIARICRMLEGSPLGIELASAWTHVLDCEEIGEEIESNLDFLATSARELPVRHRSLRAILDYSWKFLAPEERAALKNLSVFRGGFQAEAARMVTQTDHATLDTLVEKSHLHYNEAIRRYHMPLALRQYAEERLQAAPQALAQTRERLAEYFATYLKQRQIDIQYAHPKETQDDIAREFENIRTGWEWAVAHTRYDLLQQTLDPLYHFHNTRGWFREGSEFFRQSLVALARASASTTAARVAQEEFNGQLKLRVSWFVLKLGDYDEAEGLANEGLSSAREHHNLPDVALANYILGYVHHRHGNNVEGIRYFKAALRIYRPHEDWLGVVNTLNALGSVAHTQGDYAEARRLREETLKICESIQYRWGLAINLNNLGSVAMMQGEYERAQELYQRSMGILREIGNQRSLGTILTSLATVTHYIGQPEKARALYEEGRAYYRESGHRWGVAYIDLRLGFVWRDLGDHAAARASCERGQAMAEEVRNQWGIALGHILEGYLAYDERAYAQTALHFRRGIALANKMAVDPLILTALTGLAHVHVAEACPAEAARLLAVVLAHPACEYPVRETARRLADQLPAQTIAPLEPAAAIQAMADIVTAILNTLTPRPYRRRLRGTTTQRST